MLRVKTAFTPAFTDEELHSFSLEQLRNVCHFLEIKIDFSSKNLDAYIQKISAHPSVNRYAPIDASPCVRGEVDDSPKYSVRLQRIIEMNGGRIP